MAFSVVESGHESVSGAWFTTIGCREGATWKWAAAEPAVDRWGNLQ
ncbi:MAG TPA: hypothetical protein VFB75_07175 [Burkholderiales bacterium]|nr:hypothetical protein [Burkholderiales bacterium]